MTKRIQWFFAVLTVLIWAATVLHAQYWVSSSTAITTSSPVSITNNTADALTVAGGIKSGGGDVAVLNQNETVTGSWTFNGQVTSSKNGAIAVGATLTNAATDGNIFLAIDNDADTWNVGIDGANSDRFYIFNTSTATTRFSITPAGAVSITGRLNTATAQPGFLAYNSVSDSSVPSGSTVDFDTELYDTTNSFASDVFTAPAAGIYRFCTVVAVLPDAGNSFIDLVTSAGTFRLGVSAVSGTQSGCVDVNLSASQTAFVQVNNQTAGTQTIAGGSTPIVTWFSGRLLP